MIVLGLVVDGVCTLEEVETVWTIDDVLRAHAVLEMRREYEKRKEKK